MIPKLDDYRDIVGDKIVDDIKRASSALSEKHIEHVNSTYHGGGVAEILNTLTLLLNDVGIRTGWRLLKGHQDFFNITKSFHNGLQGADIELTEGMKKEYLETNEINSKLMHIEFCDCVVIHDPQPLPLIKFFKKKQSWIWRCHIDITKPNPGLWNYLKDYVHMYDNLIVSMQSYVKEDISIPSTIIPPSIDPLTTKNRAVSQESALKNLGKYGIDEEKPIISQISRFDPWKDPLGVIDSFKLVKKKVKDCQLVLLGNLASDDPEGPKIYEEVLNNSRKVDDIYIIAEHSDIMVNSLQKASQVVIQKSIREGFGLTVTEALWKGTPVVAGNVGGIPLQVIPDKNGYLVNNIKECAEAIIKLLNDPKLRENMGKYGIEHVRKNFLITRHLMDYVKLIKRMMS